MAGSRALLVASIVIASIRRTIYVSTLLECNGRPDHPLLRLLSVTVGYHLRAHTQVHRTSKLETTRKSQCRYFKQRFRMRRER
jgi:hypothetical protein